MGRSLASVVCVSSHETREMIEFEIISFVEYLVIFWLSPLLLIIAYIVTDTWSLHLALTGQYPLDTCFKEANQQQHTLGVLN